MTHNPPWRCSFCGFSDSVAYLSDPQKRERDRVYFTQQAHANQQRQIELRIEKERRLEAGESPIGLFLAEYKMPIIFVGLGVGIMGVFIFALALNSPSRSNVATNLKQQNVSNKQPAADPASYKEGSNVGYKEGRSWGRDKGIEGLPQEFAIQHMAGGWAAKKGKAADEAWKSGWVDGFKNGFAAARGGKRSLEENPNYENLSLENAKVGSKLYNNSEKHVATIVTIDNEGGLIYVRYAKGGSIEPKSITALGNTWFVKR